MRLLIDGQNIAAARSPGVVERTLNGQRQSAEHSFKVTTGSNNDLPIRSNLLDRLFTVAENDRVKAGEIAYIHTEAGWLFLAVMVELLSRQVVGRPLVEDMPRDIDALCIAWFKRHPC